MFDWYIQDGCLCGELCLVPMRQEKYILEKKTFKDSKYIEKQDRLYKNKYPSAYRFHKFVKLKVITKHESESDVFIGMYENQKYTVRIQNMDGYFYFGDSRKKRTLELLDEICS